MTISVMFSHPCLDIANMPLSFMVSTIYRHTVAILLPFTLILAACGGCAGNQVVKPTATTVPISPPRDLSIRDEIIFDDMSFDNFLAEMLRHDATLTPLGQEQAKAIRLGIILGTMMYLFDLQDPDIQAKIMELAKVHHDTTAKWHAQKQRELGIDGIPDTMTSTPAARPLQEHDTHSLIVSPKRTLKL